VSERSTNLRAAAVLRPWHIDPMTLKLESDLDTLKMYLHTENEAANLRHAKRKALLKEIRKYVSRSTVKVKMSKVPNYFERYCNRYSDQAPTIYDQ